CRVEFRSVFRAPSQKFKILAIHDILAHGKSYEHGFMKKHDGHKLCGKSPAESSFDRFFMHRLENSNYSSFPMYHGKSYEHGFTIKRNGPKLCAKSLAEPSFDPFFVHRRENSKYWPFATY
ncbi:hypothetical protein BHE74_00038085, partial [Ensete ventricosum]